VATTPSDPNSGKPDKKDLTQQMLMREVDEAVRADDVSGALKKWGLPVGLALALGLASFGGYLWWDGNRDEALQRQSELLVQAMDELEAGNFEQADQELASIDGDTSPAAMASANMLRAAIALQQGRTSDAVAFYEQVVANGDAPQPMRDASLLRLVTANYDNMEPQAVIDRLAGLAQPDSAWFGSAGELVAHAYLDQGKPEQAGPLLVSIAQDDNVPESLRARTRQLAGFYGFDAIEDVDGMLDDLRPEDGTGAAPAAAQ
jgi:hypothetical protein